MGFSLEIPEHLKNKFVKLLVKDKHQLELLIKK